ncbi:hypothetical protein N791_07775 [Lysobacter defluvii IMMIB APB-9 = DSM 18482]|uniref:Anti-bacteriophage protein A/HamA C-terminal domain-containing protein n=1 Tax=Lysobacter defluvii IMMIB APB-9 = DSM 18482 TaxID=1385515 RepID=A0A0A0MB39_9GAMM|nr:hypothetical protein N791_07775 [Lysobacter defluvii IMMIB APB-9 = DSM 18482]
MVDRCFLDFNTKSGLTPIDRKFLLSFLNDFEDGKWRDSAFDDFLWDNVAQTALTQAERENAMLGDRSRLREAAKNLRLIDKEPESSKGSEIAEIILYGLMRLHFGALPVVPKIFYKQNVNDFAKGADSVHISIDGDAFLLYFGEAKFYSSIENARLDSVVDSVRKSLETDKLKKENAIVTSLRELDTLDLPGGMAERIRAALSNRASIDDIKPLIHVPILLLHECSVTAAATLKDQAYLDAITDVHQERAQSYFERQVAALAPSVARYGEITFHLILLPVPCKKKVVDRFLTEAALLKGA